LQISWNEIQKGKVTFMRRIMKSSAIKTIVVRLTADNVFEFDVDTAVFDDPFLEASTRAVEKTKTRKYGIVRAVTECWDKKIPKKTKLYNSYWILVNASCFSKAEQLREKFKAQTDVDLANEPFCGHDNTGTK
jgi:hypothetical protein